MEKITSEGFRRKCKSQTGYISCSSEDYQAYEQAT